MKAFMKYLLLLIIPGIMAGVLSISCTEDDLPNGGTPVIYYVRVTDPAQSDSLLVAAYMGNLIAIVGDNLGGVREIWFNDQEALVTPTYVTSQSILVTVPNTPPTEINDKMTLVFSDGYVLEYDFRVDIPGPLLSSIKSEYVEDGDIAVLYGDYFFEPILITFGEEQLEAVVDEIKKTELRIIVPEGASTGNITVTTNFGSATSSFLFRDNRNILLDFDREMYTCENWTGEIAYADSAPDLEPCSGNFLMLRYQGLEAWSWQNPLACFYLAKNKRGDVPVAEGSIYDLDFRFEVNVPNEWTQFTMRIWFSIYEDGNGFSDHFHDISTQAWWRPWQEGAYSTDGWETISIPLTDFKYNKDGGASQIDDLSELTNVCMLIFSGDTGPEDININIDNLRIVPK
jgi:hypothetical protein